MNEQTAVAIAIMENIFKDQLYSVDENVLSTLIKFCSFNYEAYKQFLLQAEIYQLYEEAMDQDEFKDDPQTERDWIKAALRFVKTHALLYALKSKYEKERAAVLGIAHFNFRVDIIHPSLQFYEQTNEKIRPKHHPYYLLAQAEIYICAENIVRILADNIYSSYKDNSLTEDEKNKFYTENRSLFRLKISANHVLKPEYEALLAYLTILENLKTAKHSQPRYYAFYISHLECILINSEKELISKFCCETLIGNIARFLYEDDTKHQRPSPNINQGIFNAYYRHYRQSGISRECFEESVRKALTMPKHNTSSSRPAPESLVYLDADVLKQKIKFLAALSFYTSGDTLKMLLADKLRAEKQYFDFLDPRQQIEYYILVSYCLTSRPLISANSPLIRAHEANLMCHMINKIQIPIINIEQIFTAQPGRLQSLCDAHPRP